jgi:hypothetical protein
MSRLPILLAALALFVATTASAQQPVTVYGNNSGARQIVSVNGSGQMAITCSNCSGTGVSAVDDAVFTVGTDSTSPSSHLYDDSSPDSVDEGDVGVSRMSANRVAYVQIRDAAGNERGLKVDADGAIAISGSVGISGYTEGDTDATLAGTVLMWEDAADTVVAASGSKPLPVQSIYLPIIAGDTTDIETVLENLQLQEGVDHVSGDRGVMMFGVRQDSQADFANTGKYVPISITADGEVRVTMAAGTGGTALADGATFTVASSGLTPIGGFYQSSVDACVDGKTCAAGMTEGRVLKFIPANSDGSLSEFATDYTANADAPNDPDAPALLMERDDSLDEVAHIEGDWTQARANARGALWVTLDQNDVATIRSVTTVVDGSSTSAISAAGSGTRNFITDLECANSSATDVTVDIRDGTAGAVLWTISCPAGGGNNRAFSKPLRGAQNTAVAVDPSAAASSVIVSLHGYTRTQ